MALIHQSIETRVDYNCDDSFRTAIATKKKVLYSSLHQ